ncbi:MAG: hypothetical protein ABH951_01930 [Patescibacteria group bacterium]
MFPRNIIGAWFSGADYKKLIHKNQDSHEKNVLIYRLLENRLRGDLFWGILNLRGQPDFEISGSIRDKFGYASISGKYQYDQRKNLIEHIEFMKTYTQTNDGIDKMICDSRLPIRYLLYNSGGNGFIGYFFLESRDHKKLKEMETKKVLETRKEERAGFAICTLTERFSE